MIARGIGLLTVQPKSTPTLRRFGRPQLLEVGAIVPAGSRFLAVFVHSMMDDLMRLAA